jgi:hypothetical protein
MWIPFAGAGNPFAGAGIRSVQQTNSHRTHQAAGAVLLPDAFSRRLPGVTLNPDT